MKTRFFLLSAVPTTLILLNSCNSGGTADLENGIDSLSYCIGVNLGEAFKKGDLPKLNLEKMKIALQHVLDSSDSQQIESMEAEAFIQEFLMQHQAKVSVEKKAAGERFMVENRSKEGVMSTPSGLQYKVISEGAGAKPKPTDKVKVHYHGMLMDSTVFDSSVERGEPTDFFVNQVIPGWSEALQLMSVGSKYMLYIPQDLAYGEQGAGNVVPPFSPLIFEVELLAIDSAADSVEPE
jgi:FKBP-type peptidyl-prolyl cis-trans isomerase